MVGLVLVSHSDELASSLARFAEKVSTTRLPIATAAGVGGELGTDALAIAQAIRSVGGPDGVLVLMDLGSAVLAAEAALELLPEELRAGVRLCPAPLVEGAIAAAVQIAMGSDLQAVWQEALQALSPKAQHLASPGAAPSAARAAKDEEPYQEAAATVLNAHGLHLRPAARLVQAASRFQAEVQVANPQRDLPPVPASSLNGITTLGLAPGQTILFRARGPEARQALEALRRLAEERFGELAAPAAGAKEPPAGGPEEPPPAGPEEKPGQPGQAGSFRGIPVSEGFASGPLASIEQTELQPSERSPLPSVQEWALLEEALDRERAELEKERRDVTARLGPEKGALFEAFRLMLADPALLDPAREAVFARGRNAEQALDGAIRALGGRYGDLSDPYARQRAADIRELGQRLLRRLSRTEEMRTAASGPVLLALRELSAAAAARLDPRAVLGVLTVRGGPTSHGAVLVRSLGIPCVAGLPESLLRLPAGTTAAMDGESGTVWIAPDRQVLARTDDGRAQWLRGRAAAAARRREPAVSRDGLRFEVEANISGVAEAPLAVEQGAEGVGVLRTEFLFLDRADPPSEEEQLEALLRIAEGLEGRPLTVRTLDIGGDKPVPYASQPAEANPYLGLRGIRLCLLRPELFQSQLRAILRAAALHELRLLLPMITTLEELEGALAQLSQARAALERDGLAHRWPVQVGMMVETPSAALLIESLIERVDFASIGTNDLVQYTLAAERGNPALAGYGDALHPAVLALIRQVAASAGRRAKKAAICGEIAADPLAVPVLAGLGIRSFSLNSPGIPRIKETLRRVHVGSASRRAREILRCRTAPEVRRLAAALSEERS
jgi:phosphoenolpyruvate-protein phosphotransferase/dihydroxyacetone kinase phosphotransfer subunit